MQALKAEVVRWVFGAMIGVVALMGAAFGVLKALHGL
jgi:hypothetical protein